MSREVSLIGGAVFLTQAILAETWPTKVSFDASPFGAVPGQVRFIVYFSAFGRTAYVWLNMPIATIERLGESLRPEREMLLRFEIESLRSTAWALVTRGW